jgi:TatD DNase family protein
VSYFDTHCHIGRYKDPLTVIRRAEEAGVVTVAVTETPTEYQRLSLRLGRRRLVRVALGLHPLRAATISPMDQALFGKLLDRVEYVGEVGLDGSRDGRPTLDRQTKLFEHILGQPRIGNKILTVHSRGAEKAAIERLSSARVTGILHWYSGPLGQIDVALDAGLWFSINAPMLCSKNGQKIIRSIPMDRIVTETDGPFAKTGRTESQPKDVPRLVTDLAAVWGRPPDEVADQIYANMKAIASAAGLDVPASR